MHEHLDTQIKLLLKTDSELTFSEKRFPFYEIIFSYLEYILLFKRLLEWKNDFLVLSWDKLSDYDAKFNIFFLISSLTWTYSLTFVSPGLN